MPKLITVQIDGDTEKFQQSLTDRASEYASIASQSRAAGAIHHRFGVGDGFILVVDEWATEEQFEQFFKNPDLHSFISSVGGDPETAEVTVTDATTSPDQF